MKTNRERNRSEWAKVFSEWEESGDSQRGYCRRKGISYSGFTYWRKKLVEDHNRMSLVQVENLSALPEPVGRSLVASAGRVRVELTGRESEELLVKIFRALKAVS
jgi:hypothetical protein